MDDLGLRVSDVMVWIVLTEPTVDGSHNMALKYNIVIATLTQGT
jgi:hypothetical protein